MKGILKAEDLPEDENLYFKKDFLGYRIVHPHKNEDGSWNYWNLLIGGKRNLMFMIIVLLVIGSLLYAYSHDISIYKEVMANPCAYCPGCENIVDVGDLNLSVEGWNDN